MSQQQNDIFNDAIRLKELLFNYKVFVEKKVSNTFNPQNISLEYVKDIRKNLELYGYNLDIIKKGLFYAKLKPEVIKELSNMKPGIEDVLELSNPVKIDMLHATIGIVTESIELFTNIFDSIVSDKPLDLVNIFEEQGDIFWYYVLLMNKLGIPLEDIMLLNIKKLDARYFHRFTEEEATNRDINKELESASSYVNTHYSNFEKYVDSIDDIFNMSQIMNIFRSNIAKVVFKNINNNLFSDMKGIYMFNTNLSNGLFYDSENRYAGEYPMIRADVRARMFGTALPTGSKDKGAATDPVPGNEAQPRPDLDQPDEENDNGKTGQL